MAADDLVRRIGAQLEAEVPYTTTKKLADEDWDNIAEAIRETCPKAFVEMVNSYTK